MKAGFFLLIAGLLDALFTQLGIRFGIIEEGNPAVKLVMDKSWLLFYLIKGTLPLILLGIVLFRPLKGWVKGLMKVSCAVYLSVLAIHFTWIVYYLKAFA